MEHSKLSLERKLAKVSEERDKLKQAQLAGDSERKEKQSVIAKLESTIVEQQRLQRRSKQSDKDYQDALKAKDGELRKTTNENSRLMGQVNRFRNSSQKYEQQLERAEQVYQRRQAELEQNAVRLKGEAETCKAVLTEKAQLFAVEKLALEEQLETVNAEFKFKEKEIEIMATEKSVIDQQLGHEQANCTALTLELQERKRQLDNMAKEKALIDNELSRMKANSAALAMEVQEGRQQLETTIADNSRLSNEVLAKTQRVQQYRKQIDNYKAKLEETTARLEQAQSEVQFFQEQNKRMEGYHQVCFSRI